MRSSIPSAATSTVAPVAAPTMLRTNSAGLARALLPAHVRIGGMSRTELQIALRAQGVRLNQAAEDLFADPRFTTRAESHVTPIAAVSVAELGFDGATYPQLIGGALDLGLIECPLELGPHLRLQLLSQTEGVPSRQGRAPAGSITVASPPLDDADRTPKGFYLRRVDGVSWLRGYWSSLDHVWDPADVLVFARRED